jgi:hypothetical protein
VKKRLRFIGKSRSKRRIAQSRQTPAKSQVRMHRRLWLGTKVTVGFFVGLIGLVGSIYGMWGPPWPTEPEFALASPSFGSSFDVPFSVLNKSALFALDNLSISCVLLRLRAGGPGAQVSTAEGLSFDQAPKILARGTNLIPAGGSRPYVCPLRGFVRVGDKDAADVVQEAQIGFLMEYDARLWRGRKQTREGPFTLETKTIPPQWVKGAPLN